MRLHQVRIVAHRGNSAVLPENSMAAFRSAAMLGAHMLELDVWLSREGVPVVIHDETLDRTTTASGPVAAMHVWDLHKLGIPQLEDVLRMPIPVNVEVKTPAAIQPVVDLAFGRPDVLISSFDLDALEFLHRLSPELSLGYLASQDGASLALERAIAAEAYSLHLPAPAVTPPLLEAAHAAGLRVMAFTVDDPALGRELFGLGVDAIFTNDPARMLAIL
ncbi:MAG TPA: glycerophosphodiester phosphodiesterase family protein [Chloroflexota bacterium]|nr:glycerophosphodiester phosphodiesterase family protein [Chloroflexota bacterium]